MRKLHKTLAEWQQKLDGQVLCGLHPMHKARWGWNNVESTILKKFVTCKRCLKLMEKNNA